MSPNLPPSLSATVAELEARAVQGGGFRGRPDSAARARIDATAWAALALDAAGRSPDLVQEARDRLADLQAGDGRVPFERGRPGIFWPTALAVLAWYRSPAHRGPSERAVQFLLHSAGVPLPPDPAVGHDTTLLGWSWVLGTHSWVEPTAFAVMALRLHGLAEHPRVLEARALLLDRHLPGGGWNYGNTVVFGQQLTPSPDSTGVALSALAGLLPAASFEADFAYLEGELAALRSPLSLGWGVLGLAAWDRRPAATVEWILESLERQARLGAYDTTLVALLLLAAAAPAGLLTTLERGPSP